MTKNIKIAAIFRIIVILTAILAIICFVGVLKPGFIETGDDEAMYDALRTASNVYPFMAAGVFVSLVLSFISQTFCKKISLVARTFFILVGAIFSVVAFKANFIISKVCEILDEYDSVRYVTASDLGMTAAEFNEIENFSENQIMVYIIAVVVISLIFIVLGFTSIHYLVKKKNHVQA